MRLCLLLAPLAVASLQLRPTAGLGVRMAPSPLIVRAASPCCSAVPPPTEPSRDNKEADDSTDPRKALEELGSLVEQIQVLWRDGKSWSEAERTDRRRQLIETYVRVFAPAVAFSAVQLSIYLGAFGVSLLALGVSGRGYADVADLSAGVPLVGDAVAGLDPSVGNAAIVLLFLELLGPLFLGVALALSPAATKALRGKLEEWGLDADGVNRRIEEVLKKTS